MTTAADILALLTGRGHVFEHLGAMDVDFSHPAPLDACDADSIVWSRDPKVDLAGIPARALILPRKASAHLSSEDMTGKAVFLVENPRAVFRDIVISLFSDRIAWSRGLSDPLIMPRPHGSSGPVIGAGAVIHESVALPESVTIHPNVVIYPNVELGERVEIGAGSCLGGPGFGFVREESGRLEQFPHIGGVVIGDDVSIGANTCIDSGGLGPTTIGAGTKISNFCQIAHNVSVGSRCLITGKVQIGGGSRIGDETYLGPSVVISNKLSVGRRCDIKIGSVVVTDIPDGETVSGYFAVDHRKTLRDFAKRRS